MPAARDRTYRSEPMWKLTAATAVSHLVGRRVVVYGSDGAFHYAYLVRLSPKDDTFYAKYSRRSPIGRTYTGIWRVHDPQLFKGFPKPMPLRELRVFTLRGRRSKLHSTNSTKVPGGTSMATKSKTKQVEETKRGRRSPLDDLTPKQHEQLAKRVMRLREQGVPWDGDEGICAQEELINSATVGRKLLREYGGEGMIRDRVVNGGGARKTTAKKTTTKKAAAKPAAKKKVVVRGTRKKANP